MAENGLRPIRDFAATDIFICGYPRSGNTWFQYLLAGVVHGIDPEFAPDALIQDLVPDIDYKRYFKRYGPIAFFKAHALPQKDYRRVVYLLRDGRDAMVSFYHFLTALRGKIDFLRLVEGEGLTPCAWHKHVERWTANPYGADLIVIKYEDLHASPVRELRRFCTFAGLPRDDAHLEYVAAKAAFINARAKEVRDGWDNPQWPREQAFLRRGVVGSHRDEMPAEVMTAFLRHAQPTLTRWGYLS